MRVFYRDNFMDFDLNVLLNGTELCVFKTDETAFVYAIITTIFIFLNAFASIFAV